MFNFVPKRIRSGIIEWLGWCRCDLHGITWKEGDNFKEFGGRACSYCVKRSKTIYRISNSKYQYKVTPINSRGKIVEINSIVGLPTGTFLIAKNERVYTANIIQDKKGCIKVKGIKKHGK